MSSTMKIGGKVFFLRTPYNYDTDLVSNETALKCEEKSLTQQNFKDECDINNIVDRWLRTGETPVSDSSPQYGDFTGITDYHSAMNKVIDARKRFNDLPADIRKRFNYDPGELLDFVNNPDNEKESVELGLLPKIEKSVKVVEEKIPKVAEVDGKFPEET